MTRIYQYSVMFCAWCLLFSNSIAVFFQENLNHNTSLLLLKAITFGKSLPLGFANGKCSGLMVSVLASGSSGPGFESWPAWEIVFCSWARHLPLTICPGFYKWVMTNLMLGVAL